MGCSPSANTFASDVETFVGSRQPIRFLIRAGRVVLDVDIQRTVTIALQRHGSIGRL
jgi:hypothetical protein